MLNKLWVKILILVVLVGAIGFGGYYYNQYIRISGDAQAREMKQLVASVGRLMLLPDEIPTVATVQDITKLSNQRFFRNAQNGDKVLIYPLASKAILYRPKLGKIVEVASVLPTGDQPVAKSSSTQLVQAQAQVVSGQMSVVLMNGTTSLGLTSKMEKLITDKVPEVDIASKDTASRTDYQQTIIVDLSGKYKQRINDLASLLGAKVAQLPSGEARPNSDVLIIFGKSSL